MCHVIKSGPEYPVCEVPDCMIELIDVAASNIDLGDEFTKEVVVNEVNNNRDFHFESNPMETGEVNKNYNTISIFAFKCFF